MLMLTGEANNPAIVRRVRELGWGRMYIMLEPRPYPGEPWGFDNGAYRNYLAGREFDGNGFLRRLDRAYRMGFPLLAVAPDVVAGGMRSLEFSLHWRDRLPADWPWFLAVQDGMTLEAVRGVMPLFAGLFLGGSDSFKATAWHWAEMARRHGKQFHYGRAGTERKLRHAQAVGADSCDSAFPLWTRARLDRTLRILGQLNLQAELWGPGESASRVEEVRTDAPVG